MPLPPVESVEPASPVTTRRPAWWLLAVVVVCAFALRVLTVRQSLPFVDHPDEPNPIDYVVEMLRSGDPNQRFFQKPSLYIYLLLSVLQVQYAWGLAQGLYTDIRSMLVTTATITTVPEFFLWGRILTASLGSLSVVGVYFLAQRMWNHAAGILAAVIVTLLPFHIRHSQFVTTDVLAALLVVFSVAGALAITQAGAWRAYLVAGVFAGLAASSKYNAGIVALAVAVAHLVYWRTQSVRQLPRLVGAGVAALGGFVAGTPYALLQWQQVSGGLLGQVENYDGGNGDYRGAWNFAGYAEFFWGDGLGPLLGLAVIVGIGLLARHRPRMLAVWLSFVLPSLLLHLSFGTHFMRNMLPILLLCAVPAAVSVTVAAERIAPRLRLPPSTALILLSVLLLLPSVFSLAPVMQRQLRGDTRVELLAWLEANVGRGERIAAELKAIPGPYSARWVDIPDVSAYDLDFYRAQGFSYLIASSKRWGSLNLPERYALLHAAVVAEFGSNVAGERIGHHLYVFATGLAVDRVVPPLLPPAPTFIGDHQFLGAALGDPSGSGTPPVLLPRTTFKPDSVLGIRTFWRAYGSTPTPQFLFVHLIDAAGNRVVQRDAPPHEGFLPTSGWPSGELIVDVNDLYLPPNLAPGDYQIRIGMYDPSNGVRPPVKIGTQFDPESSLLLTTITVAP